MRNNKAFRFFLEMFGLVTILVAICCSYLSHKFMAFYNADMLYLPILFQDLFYNGGFYKDWSLAPIPYFFPDWFVFSIAFISTKVVYKQLLINACLNVLLLYLALRLIYRQFFNEIKTIIFSLTSLSVFIYLALNGIQPYIAVLLPNIHVGGFIAGLLFCWAQIKLLFYETKKDLHNSNFIVLLTACTISFLAGISDLLYIVQFSVPVFLSYIIFFNKEISSMKKVKFSLLPFLSSIFGGWLLKYIVPNPTLEAYLSNPSILKYSLQPIIHLVIPVEIDFLKRAPFPIMLLFIIFYFILLSIIVFSLNKRRFNFKFIFLDRKKLFIIYILFLSVLISFLSVGLIKSFGIRYAYPFFCFPVLFFFIALSSIKKIINTMFYGALIVLLACVIFFGKEILNTKIKKEYYPKNIQCIDKAIHNKGHFGIAQYWVAFPISIFSREKIKILAYQSNLKPFTFIGNKKWFKNKCSFFIINNQLNKNSDWDLDEKLIKSMNGEPKKIVNCENNSVLIYPEKTIKTKNLSEIGDQLSWSASELPSEFKKNVKFKERSVQKVDGQGYVTFGPYVFLASGKYKIDIIYASDASPNKIVGHWDIVSNEKNLLYVSPLSGTNNQLKKITSELIVPVNLDLDVFQIRTFTLGNSKFRVRSLNLLYKENLHKS